MKRSFVSLHDARRKVLSQENGASKNRITIRTEVLSNTAATHQLFWCQSVSCKFSCQGKLSWCFTKCCYAVTLRSHQAMIGTTPNYRRINHLQAGYSRSAWEWLGKQDSCGMTIRKRKGRGVNACWRLRWGECGWRGGGVKVGWLQKLWERWGTYSCV